MFGFGFNFGLMQILVSLMFVVVLSIFVIAAVRGLSQWNKNNHSPRLTVDATVVSKRVNVTHHHGTNHVGHGHTSYYVTFQVESGDRMELNLTGPAYGLMVEGDHGRLTFQGTRFLDFRREV